MEDFIFGGIERDEEALNAAERNRWRGIRHLHAIQPLDPRPGQPVTITVFVGPDVNIDQVSAYVSSDDHYPTGRRGVAEHGFSVALQRVQIQWQPLIWNYVEIWQAQLPAQPTGTRVHYCVEGWCSYDATVSVWSREPNLERTAEQPALYGYHVDEFETPRWAHEAITYHIFVDRFTGVENRWLTAAELNSFTGGTLRGVIDQLDYLVDLGVTVLWLSPIFRTPTYHGYDTSDYFTVDPRFGTNDDLRELVTIAHARGLRVLLDFVANHTSVEFAPFVEAQHNPASAYRDWFSFDPVYKHGYRGFFDEASMPQLDTDHPAVRHFLINAARYWLREYDVDGYRLDYAAGPSHAFWSEFRAACRQVKPDCWLFGEVTLAGDALRTYTGRLDGCLDFAFARNVRLLCASTQPAITIGQFANAIERGRAFFSAAGDASNFTLPTFIDNHDMNRFLWMVGNDKDRLRLAAGLLFALGGSPVIYYGTEVGLSQPRPKGPWREEARHPMLWGAAQDQALLADFKAWIRVRRQHPALAYGGFITHLLDALRRLWLLERAYADDRVLVAINAGEQPQRVELPEGDFQKLDQATVRGTIMLPGLSCTILTVANNSLG